MVLPEGLGENTKEKMKGEMSHVWSNSHALLITRVSLHQFSKLFSDHHEWTFASIRRWGEGEKQIKENSTAQYH